MVKVKEDMTGWKMWEHGVPDSRLIVLKQTEDYVSPNGKRKARWLCECSCSEHNIIKATGNAIRKGNTKSCGCLQKEEASRIGHEMRKGNNYQLDLEDERGLYGIGYCSNTNNEFYFDMDDYEKIKNYTWSESVTANGYRVVQAYDTNDDKVTRLFWIVAGKYYDHHDRNPFNNRKYNLWEATIQENTRNATKRKDNTSGFIGIYWHKTQCVWHAAIREDNKRKHLGSFRNKEDAIKARLQAEAIYYGEFAPQRHLFKEYGIKPNNT